MTLDLTKKIPLLERIGFLKKYSLYLKQIDFKVDPVLWIILSFLVSFVVGAAIILLVPELWQLGIIMFLVIADIMIGYPYLKASQRIDDIERNLSDALKQMADTLRAGGTYEYALREVASAEYGYLKKEINTVLRKLEEGDNFETALSSLSQNVDSRLVKRTVTIIIDSVKAGAGLADILDEISEDVRAIHRINAERKTRTILQVLFMVAAGGFVAPLIFGFVATISSVLISTAAKISKDQLIIQRAESASSIINLGIQIYLLVEVFAASLVIAIMREGRISKSIIYFPILLLVAYTTYILGQLLSMNLVS